MEVGRDEPEWGSSPSRLHSEGRKENGYSEKKTNSTSK